MRKYSSLCTLMIPFLSFSPLPILWELLFQSWKNLLCIGMIYTVCLSLYPGITTSFLSPYWQLRGWFPIILIAIFDIGELIGTMLATRLCVPTPSSIRNKPKKRNDRSFRITRNRSSNQLTKSQTGMLPVQEPFDESKLVKSKRKKMSSEGVNQANSLLISQASVNNQLESQGRPPIIFTSLGSPSPDTDQKHSRASRTPKRNSLLHRIKRIGRMFSQKSLVVLDKVPWIIHVSLIFLFMGTLRAQMSACGGRTGTDYYHKHNDLVDNTIQEFAMNVRELEFHDQDDIVELEAKQISTKENWHTDYHILTSEYDQPSNDTKQVDKDPETISCDCNALNGNLYFIFPWGCTDWAPLLLVAYLGISTGWLGSLGMMQATCNAEEDEREAIQLLENFVVLIGLSLGSTIGVFLVVSGILIPNE